MNNNLIIENGREQESLKQTKELFESLYSRDLALHNTKFVGVKEGREDQMGVTLRYVKSKIAQGADIFYKDEDGNTMLHAYARQCGNNVGRTEVMEFLLAQGLDVNARNKKGETPLALYAISRHQYGGTPEVVEQLLDAGANPALTINYGASVGGDDRWSIIDLARHFGDDGLVNTLQNAIISTQGKGGSQAATGQVNAPAPRANEK